MKQLIILFILPLFITTSCKKDGLKNCDEHTTTECKTDDTKANIRIVNKSSYDLCNVSIGHYGTPKYYGALKKGANTCYLEYDIAYHYSYIAFTINGEEFELQPIDFVGEVELEPGLYSYQINVNYKTREIFLKCVND